MKRYLAWLLSATVLFGCLTLAACGARSRAAAIGRNVADPVFYGDANGDGEADMKDVLTIRLYVAGLTSEINLSAADINRDGQVNMKDVLCVRRCIAGLDAWPTADVSDVISDPISDEELSEEPSEAVSEAVSEPVSEEPSEPADDTVIYDADVDVTLTPSPGRTYSNAGIAFAFEREHMTYGIAEYYTLTVQIEAEEDDFIYPILLGGNDAAEAWPVSEFDRGFSVSATGGGTVFGTVAGSVFDNAKSAPKQLFFYSERGSNTIVLKHITIQVIRRVTEPTTTAPPTVATTHPTAAPTRPSDLTRPTGTEAYTVVDGVPYITFRSYSDEGTLGVWWWGGGDAENAATCDEYLSFLYENGVNEIFFYGYHWTYDAEGRDRLHTFVQKANAYGMVVSLLYDDADAIAGRQNLEMTRIANNYLNYCAAYPSDRMNGIHFDVEGVSRENMVNYMISQFPAARERGVKIAMDLNCGWRDEITYNGVTGIYNIIAANIDTMSLMSYRDKADRIWSFGANAFAAAKAYGTKITFGVETGDSHEGNSVDFSAESKREVCSELAQVYSRLREDHPTGGYGLAIHHVAVWYHLRNE